MKSSKFGINYHANLFNLKGPTPEFQHVRMDQPSSSGMCRNSPSSVLSPSAHGKYHMKYFSIPFHFAPPNIIVIQMSNGTNSVSGDSKLVIWM